MWKCLSWSQTYTILGGYLSKQDSAKPNLFIHGFQRNQNILADSLALLATLESRGSWIMSYITWWHWYRVWIPSEHLVVKWKWLFFRIPVTPLPEKCSFSSKKVAIFFRSWAGTVHLTQMGGKWVGPCLVTHRCTGLEGQKGSLETIKIQDILYPKK